MELCFFFGADAEIHSISLVVVDDDDDDPPNNKSTEEKTVTMPANQITMEKSERVVGTIARTHLYGVTANKTKSDELN